MNDKNYQAIHSKNLMMFLVRKGFDVMNVTDCDFNNKFKMFIFKNSNELIKAIDEYSNMKITR